MLVAAGLAGMQVVPAAAADLTWRKIPAPNVVNPCNGELVLTSGTVNTATLSNNRHLLQRANFAHVTGVGSVTGLRYIVTGANQFHTNFNSRNGQAEFTTIVVVHLIVRGTGQRFSNTFVFHNVGTPSGHITVSLHTRERC